MKKLFYGMGIVVLFLLAIFLLVRTGTSLFLATDRGQEVARRVIEKQAMKKGGLRVKVDRISGSLLDSAQLEGVKISDSQNEEILRAQRVDLKYELSSILRHRPEISATLIGPEFSAGAPPPLPDVRDLDADVEIRDGKLGKDMAIEQGHLRVKRRGDHWDGTFTGRVSGAKLPRDLQVDATAKGPADALDVDAKIDTGRGKIVVDGIANLEEKQASGDLTVEGLAVDFAPSASNMVVNGKGTASLEDQNLKLRFDADYERVTPPADLVGVVSPEERRRLAQPASKGQLHAVGEGRVENGVDLKFNARLVEAGSVTRLVSGGGARARSMVVVDGRFSRRPRQPAVLRVHSRTVPIQ